MTLAGFFRIYRGMRRFVLAALALGAGLSSTHAAQLVVFEDGRGLRVLQVDVADGLASLTLEDGGQIAVPEESIVSIEPSATLDEPATDGSAAGAAEAAGLADTLREGERWRAAAGRYADTLALAADRHGLDRALLAAVAKVESNFNPFAVSPKGACGLLQLMPATARRFGVANVFDVEQNVEGGARYLRWLLDRFEGRVDLALAGYNAGEGAVDRHRGIPPYAETQWYVLKVLDRATR